MKEQADAAHVLVSWRQQGNQDETQASGSVSESAAETQSIWID